MKLGDMTVKQVAEICTGHECNNCPFYDSGTFFGCLLLQHFPSFQNLDMEVNIDAEDQS